MIKKPTVFILGAGASYPFGFPLAAGLRELICSLSTVPKSPVRDRLRKVFETSESQYREFSEEFKKSGLASIDSFLGRRLQFEEVGKNIIASCISHYEVLDSLYRVAERQGFSDLYGLLWNKMMEGVHTPEELTLNRISFITFNYDRSLEAYFHQAIKSTFALNDGEAEQVWAHFPIHHVYGSLGKLQPSTGLIYGAILDSDSQCKLLREASANIKVMPAARTDEKDVKAIQMISKADVVGIFGFGFDEVNCRRIEIPEALTMRAEDSGELVDIYGTMYGLTSGEVGASLRRLFGDSPAMANVRFGETTFDCLRSFRDWNHVLG